MCRHLSLGSKTMTHLSRSPRLRAALLAAATSLLPITAQAQGPVSLPMQTTCSYSNMLRDLRHGLREGSPTLKRYLLEQFKEAARAMPADELLAAVAHEREPAVLEVLGAGLAAKAGFVEDPSLVQPVLQRAMSDGDPALRAAALRSLERTGSVEMMEKNGGVVTYSQLIRDPSPEVRAAVASNLITENAKVYFGNGKGVSEAAVAAAVASPDPAVAAKLLREVSMAKVGPEAVDQLRGQLRADDAELRAAAASALGGVPGPQSASARGSLVELYRTEKDPAVRKAALAGIVRAGFSGSRATLESLRGVAPGMDPEIDAWLAALKLNVQEWTMLLREKERIRK
jgi:HEAT repeat protein